VRVALARIIAATSFGFVLVPLDVTIVNVTLPRIDSELSAGVDLTAPPIDANEAFLGLCSVIYGFGHQK